MREKVRHYIMRCQEWKRRVTYRGELDVFLESRRKRAVRAWLERWLKW